MRLTTVILLASLLQVSAATFGQRITLDKKNVPLESILKEIRKQSGYDIFYYDQTIPVNQKISVNVQNVELSEALESTFKGLPLTFEIEGRIVTIKKDGKNLLDNLVARFKAIDVRGRVVDSLGNGIPGASVKIINQNRGTSTGSNGEFSIKSVEDNAIIIISYLGYISKKIPVQPIVYVILEQATSKLDEIRVIAYGTTSKRLSTSSLIGISAQDLKTQPVGNPLLALAGRTPGVTVTQSSGLSGTGVTVAIQGQNSIDKGNDPFFVIDGIPYSTNTLPTISNVLGVGGRPGSSGISGAGNPLSFINTNDIESIEILKDADATAIYGSRAANGAVLITTKKGKAGQTIIDITTQTGFGHVARKLNLLNTSQYLEMRREAYLNDGEVIPDSSIPIDQKRFDNYDLTVWDQTRSTDWQKELLGGTSKFTDIQTGISGGTNQTIFRINAAFHRETSVFPKDVSDEKASLGFNLNHSSVNQRFKMQFSGNYMDDLNRLPTFDLTNTALILSPNAPALYKDDTSLNWEQLEINTTTKDSVSTFTNPLADLQNDYNVKTKNLISNISLSYKINKNFTVRTTAGYTEMNSREATTNKLIALAPEFRPFVPRRGFYANGETTSWIVEPQFDYHTVMGNGELNVLLGSSFQQNENRLEQFLGEGFNSDLVIDNILAAATISRGGGLMTNYKYNAAFSRINYNLSNKYIINITARRDGSSRFGSENRFHNFGAFGGAWLFSNEQLIKNILPILSFGKIRGSYGTTGNDQIGEYNFLSIYDAIESPILYGGGNGLQVNRISNPYLQWETTKKFQVGADLGFIEDRVMLNLNYFNNKSTNQLISYALPNITGFPGITKNFPAKVQNEGWECVVTTLNFNNEKFRWNTTLNLTLPRNKLLAFPNLSQSSYASKLVIGEPINIVKAFSYAGVNTQTGLYQFNSANGDLVSNPSYADDRIVLINSNPTIYGGFLNTLSYAGLELSFLIQFNRSNALGYKLGVSPYTGNNFNTTVDVLERWQKPGDDVKFQKFSNNELILNTTGSDFVYTNASYLRLKNASVSWNLPSVLQSKIKLRGVRIFAQGQNLLTYTKYVGLDPENASASNLPPLRVMTFGVQINL